MSIYHDDFEGYALGNTTNPFGDFTRNLNPAQIVADNYLPAGSKALRTAANSSEVYYSTGGLGAVLYGSGTVYVALKFDINWNNQTFFQFWNGNPFPGADPAAHPVFTLGTNFDGTISAFAPNSTLVSTPCGVTTQAFHQSGWYFLQVNFVMTDVAGFVTIDFEVAMDKVTVLSGTVVTGLATSSLESGTAQFNYVKLTNTLKWDEFDFDTLQAIGTFPNPGSPSARVTTGLIEVIEATTSSNACISTGLIELIISGDAYVYEA